MLDTVLILGKGFLGTAISSVAMNLGIHSIALPRSGNGVDITNIGSIERVIQETNPSLIINCAACTHIDEIERNPREAYEINAYGAKNVALVAQKHEIKHIHISTDSVFDGKKGMYTETDIPNPINEYTKSKKLGEDMVKEVSESSIILRTNFYGFHEQGKQLFNWVLENLQNNKIMTGFVDVIFNPLEVKNLATMIIELGSSEFCGIIHLTSDEIMSKYEFAVKIADILGYDSNLVEKGKIVDRKYLAKRPLNTTLCNTMAKRILKTNQISLQEWLKNNEKSFTR